MNDLENRVKKHIKLDNNIALKVGFLDSVTYPNGVKVADVARYNEFGTATIPARPFMTNTILKNKNKWKTKFTNILQQNNDLEASLNALAVIIKGDIQREITDLREPPNSAKTIKAKGSSNPLIDTGLMRRSVDFVVTKGNN